MAHRYVTRNKLSSNTIGKGKAASFACDAVTDTQADTYQCAGPPDPLAEDLRFTAHEPIE